MKSMKIVAGNSVIEAIPMLERGIMYGGQMVEGIRLVSEGAFTPEQLADLANNPWLEYGEDNALIATVEGFDTLYQSTVVFLKIPDLVRENAALRVALAAKDAELQAANAQLNIQGI